MYFLQTGAMSDIWWSLNSLATPTNVCIVIYFIFHYNRKINPFISICVASPVDLQGASGVCEKDAQTVLQWLTKVQELREEIEGLRQLVCNKYAEELGNNLSCATQWLLQSNIPPPQLYHRNTAGMWKIISFAAQWILQSYFLHNKYSKKKFWY